MRTVVKSNGFFSSLNFQSGGLNAPVNVALFQLCEKIVEGTSSIPGFAREGAIQPRSVDSAECRV